MENQAKEFKFQIFDVQRVKNGFILTMNRANLTISDDVYVFQNLEQLSEFIKNLN